MSKLTGLNAFAEAHGLSPIDVVLWLGQLSYACQQVCDKLRCSTEAGGKRMAVLGSRSLEQEIHPFLTNTLD